MKTNRLTILSIFILFAVVLFTSCSKSDDPSPETKIKKLLVDDGNKTWKLQSLTVSGTNQTALFTGLTIKFSNTGYTTTNGGVIWPSSDTWNFTDSKATVFLRGDGMEVQVDVTENSLTLSLPWDKKTYAGGKVNSVPGPHVFKFSF